MGQESVGRAPGPGSELSEVLRTVLAAVRPVAESRSVSLNVVQQTESIRLAVDPASAGDLFRTLLTTAVGCCAANGCVEMLICRPSDRAIVQVKLTPPFAAPQANFSAEPGASGALQNAMREIERFGAMVTGQIALSESPAEFVISLPTTAEPLPKPNAKPPLAAERSLRVLVVDDNVASARLLGKLLARLEGHTVEEAYSGKSALDAAARFRPEVVFLDIGLPDLSGHEVAKQIRAGERGKDLLLVALTGYGLDEDRERSFQAGFDEHLLKPASPDVLQRVLSHPKLAALAAQRRSSNQ